MATNTLRARNVSLAPARLLRPWCATGLALWAVAAIAGGWAFSRAAPSDATSSAERTARLELLTRATRRAVVDAERCAGELRVLADRAPRTVARALEVEPAAIAAARSGAELAALALGTIAARADATRDAAGELGRVAAGGGAPVAIVAARAHAAAERLCLAREAAAAASLRVPAPRREALLRATR